MPTVTTSAGDELFYRDNPSVRRPAPQGRSIRPRQAWSLEWLAAGAAAPIGALRLGPEAAREGRREAKRRARGERTDA